MRKTLSVIVIGLLWLSTFSMLAPQVKAEEPLPTEWSETYGGAGEDSAYSMVQTVDGGYILAGRTNSYGLGGYDFWVVKTDATGSIEWSETYGGTRNDGAHSVVQTGDGGYAIAGYTESFGAGGADFWLIKIDSTGAMEWNQTYGGANNDYAYSMVETVGGGYALAGATWSFSAGGADLWLIKTDSLGNILWNQTYGGTSDDVAQDVVQNSDGGYAIVGYTASFGAGWRDVLLVITDSSGIMSTSYKMWGGSGEEMGRSLVETVDGGYAIAAFTTSYGAGNKDFWLIKTDTDGSLEWDRTYGGVAEDQAHTLVETNDGGYALAGYTASYGAGGWDFWLVKTDLDGDLEWDQTYGGTGTDQALSVVETVDGGYAITGFTGSFGAGSYDMWLVKLAPALSMSDTFDPTDDLYYYQSGSPAPVWGVMDIVYAEISQVDSANIKLSIKTSQPIPLTNQWQGYNWLLDTGIPAPPWWNPIDSNDMPVAYFAQIAWAANGALYAEVVNAVDETVIFYEDFRDNPGKYFSGDTCSITIPLSWIGNPISIQWVAGSTDGIASPSGKHDKAPNTGHVTLAISAPTEPDFEISVSPESQTVETDESVSYDITLTPLNGFDSEVYLFSGWVGTPPAGEVPSLILNPWHLSPPGTSSFTVDTYIDTQLGQFAIEITAVSFFSFFLSPCFE